MFTLGYFSGAKELIPSGWNVVDEDKNYPSLASRAPQTEELRDDSPDGFEVTSGRAGSDSSTEDDQPRTNDFSGQTRMNDESSDEDELSAPSVPKVSWISII